MILCSIWGSCIDDYVWNSSTCNSDSNIACKIDEYLDIENCLHEKYLLDKLVLAREEEILNTTEISLNDKQELHLQWSPHI